MSKKVRENKEVSGKDKVLFFLKKGSKTVIYVSLSMISISMFGFSATVGIPILSGLFAGIDNYIKHSNGWLFKW